MAKHFNISLKEVHEMSAETFQQSLVWTLVGRSQEEKQMKRRQQEAKSGGRETVSLDYDWLEMEDF